MLGGADRSVERRCADQQHGLSERVRNKDDSRAAMALHRDGSPIGRRAQRQAGLTAIWLMLEGRG